MISRGIPLFLAGGTSDLGERVASGLVALFGQESLLCLVRKTSDVSRLKKMGIKLVVGDVQEAFSFSSLIGPETIYIDMTHPKYYSRSIDIIANSGVQRAFFITTTGIFSQYRSAAGVYIDGEQRIKNSGIDYTILRPSMIYGTYRDRNMTRLLQFLERWPFFPVFGSGRALMQPVYVADLAEGILRAIVKKEKTRKKEYNLCGPEPITYMSLLMQACQMLGITRTFIHIPHSIAAGMVAWAEKIPGFPITYEQVLRLAEDKCFEILAAQSELDYRPRCFSEGIRLEIECLRAKGLLRSRRMK